jgi:hypothetical protein
MNKRILIAILVFTLLAFAAASAWAAAGEGTVPDLVPTSFSVKPEAPYPGQEIVVAVDFQNQGDTAIKDAKVPYIIEVEDADILLDDDYEVTNLEPGGEGEFTKAFYAPKDERTYDLNVTFNGETRQFKFVVETALPPEVARLFAGLGVFAAVMAIMAVGTEVVLEPFKSVLGLKQKVSAMEALDQLKKELPGQLTGLGVDTGQIKGVQALFDSLETTLEPVTNINAALDAIKKGLLGDAITEIEEMGNLLPAGANLNIPEVRKKAEKSLEEWKETVISKIEEGFAKLRDILPFSDVIASQINEIEKRVIDEIKGVRVEDLINAANKVPELHRAVIEPLQKALADPAQAKSWLDSQVDTVLEGGKDQVVKLVDENLIPTLRGLGFQDDHVGAFEKEVKAKLDSAGRFAQHQMTTYTKSVRNLLLAVEDRRQEMQSPARKIWRTFRDNKHLTLGAAIAFLVFSVGGIVLAVLIGPSWGAVWWLAVVGGLVLGLLAAWGVQKRWPASEKLGEFLQGIEQWINRLRDPDQKPENYGKIHHEAEKRIKEMLPSSVAKVLLQEEDKHRDEETSRLRLLRVFSIIVGVVLAYWLRIDAAEYLNYAIPGIQEQVNNVVPFAAWHNRWAWIPEELTVGIVLTGLAAAAGSKFWRDLLGRLQTARGQAEEAARLVRQVKGTVGLERQEPQ